MRAVVDLVARLAEAEARYVVVANPESRRLHEERARFMPGGNTRTTIHERPSCSRVPERVALPPRCCGLVERARAGRRSGPWLSTVSRFGCP
jgi:hypothetical protein